MNLPLCRFPHRPPPSAFLLRRLLRVCTAVMVALALATPAAQAQPAAAYPNKPIKLIVPFPAGGGGDTLARLVMLRAARELGQPIVVENLGGAGGNVGSAAAAKAPADGYTLLYGTNGTHVLSPDICMGAEWVSLVKRRRVIPPPAPDWATSTPNDKNKKDLREPLTSRKPAVFSAP